MVPTTSIERWIGPLDTGASVTGTGSEADCTAALGLRQPGTSSAIARSDAAAVWIGLDERGGGNLGISDIAAS